MTTIWILWLIFTYTSGKHTAIPVTRDPDYETEAACLVDKEALTLQLRDLWPDPKARVEKIEAECYYRTVQTEPIATPDEPIPAPQESRP